jgi:hypothetical protein
LKKVGEIMSLTNEDEENDSFGDSSEEGGDYE